VGERGEEKGLQTDRLDLWESWRKETAGAAHPHLHLRLHLQARLEGRQARGPGLDNLNLDGGGDCTPQGSVLLALSSPATSVDTQNPISVERQGYSHSTADNCITKQCPWPYRYAPARGSSALIKHKTAGNRCA